MPKFLLSLTLVLLLAIFLASPAWPQETESGSLSGEPESEVAEIGSDGQEPEETVALEQSDEADEIDDSDLDDSDLDEQTYEEDEDDFIPSEEIPVDQPIPFPSNI